MELAGKDHLLTFPVIIFTLDQFIHRHSSETLGTYAGGVRTQALKNMELYAPVASIVREDHFVNIARFNFVPRIRHV